MFENITKKVITTIKKTAKNEINATVDAQIPFIVGTIILGATILSFIETKKIKDQSITSITINNYYGL